MSTSSCIFSLAVWPIVLIVCPVVGAPASNDPRNIENGSEIPTENYADQPYVVVLPDGAWLCVLTTGAGNEGQDGQHIVSTKSIDQGRSWSTPVPIEESSGPEASWVMPLLTDFGRVYVFYSFNGDRFGKPENPNSPNIKHLRTDMLGWYCYRYSDDGGMTWSNERYRLPVRMTAADYQNTFDGKVQLFWGVGKPIRHQGSAFFSFTKIKSYMLTESEGWGFRSDNILTEKDPEKIHWEMFPRGENPIRNPRLGPVQSEHNLASLPDGGLVCMYRTVQGHPAVTYSADSGETWTLPEYARYSPGGRRLKHPRACPRIWRCQNGKYLFWFHNHGGHDFTGRNPAWVVGGAYRDGRLHWSEPEILLYHEDPNARTSYPDLIEQDGKYWVTETEKKVARVHEVDPKLLQGMWHEVENNLPDRPIENGCVGDFSAQEFASGAPLELSEALSTARGQGFTIELWTKPQVFAPGQVILRGSGPDDAGWSISTELQHQLKLAFSDGVHKAQWSVDPYVLREDVLQHVVFVVDGGPKIVSVIVDGRFCDGGDYRQFGWGRFDPQMGQIDGRRVRVDGNETVALHHLRVYRRALRTSEVVQNYRAGLEGNELQ